MNQSSAGLRRCRTAEDHRLQVDGDSLGRPSPCRLGCSIAESLEHLGAPRVMALVEVSLRARQGIGASRDVTRKSSVPAQCVRECRV